MPCAPCAAAAARRAAQNEYEYVWTSADNQTVIVYAKEEVAKAKVMRKGGSYHPQRKRT